MNMVLKVSMWSQLIRRASVWMILALAVPATAGAQGWAVEVGPSYDIQHGTFVAPCTCTFGFGSGVGWIGAMSFDVVSFGGFSIGGRIGMDMQQFTSKELTEDALAQIANGDREKITLTYLSLEPYLRYHFPGFGLFVQVAPGWEYLVSSTFQHVPGAESTEAPVAAPDAPIDVTKTRIDAKLSAGYSIPFLGMALEPTVSTALPLTDLGSLQSTNWHIATYYVTLAIRFGL